MFIDSHMVLLLTLRKYAKPKLVKKLIISLVCNFRRAKSIFVYFNYMQKIVTFRIPTLILVNTKYLPLSRGVTNLKLKYQMQTVM